MKKNKTSEKQGKQKRSGAKLGQHLLTSRSIARAVGEAAGVHAGDTVLEIGPGKGMLTAELLALGARVVAIEKDRAMVAILKTTFAKEISSGRLSLIEDDIRRFSSLITLNSLLFSGPYKVAANIPYYITGEIIRLLLTAPHQPTDIALLVQKEVAERIARSKKESLLSLSVKVYGAPCYVRTVKAGSFNPPPSVDSAILAFHHISRNNFVQVNEQIFFDLLHAGFAQKRKLLASNIKTLVARSVPEKTPTALLAEAGIAEKARAEDVNLSNWLLLASLLE